MNDREYIKKLGDDYIQTLKKMIELKESYKKSLDEVTSLGLGWKNHALKLEEIIKNNCMMDSVSKIRQN